ncbi:hypothetical protein PRIPAC_89035 [Pristionchus pacificus]|uniref:Uncharacterized protein n=1 Tax=Pristionchus pacificus TaxID=54126 RepID=A0A2A6CXT9_PRIPA|nr:hypothetical protein PRIPAC_89035 [Pristionchus pacificus]|eukprot:PDM82843.1 hypothetical protein PRIPAC_37236 [Pristionchus pacificus]
MSLREYRTVEELTALLELELAQDPLRENPSTALLDSTLRIVIEGEYPITHLDVLGFPYECPKFVYGMETSEIAQLVIDRYRKDILKHGRIVISADKATSDVFESVLSEIFGDKVTRLANYECGLFYMTAQQRDTLLSMEIVPPEGFTLQPVDDANDVEIIHSCWKNAISLDITKARVSCFPSISARDSNGNLGGWAISGRFGQISHEYVVPEHRGKGLGRALELTQAQLLARNGRRVVKDVDTDNAFAFEGSLKSPFWTLWKEDGETKANYFRRFQIQSDS